jgi:dephospho-CoA kinase
MKIFGLTANIGCGKSTVSSVLSTYPDVTVLDCDTIAKNLSRIGEHNEKINAILGEDVFPAGIPDTKRIAEIIFTDTVKKERMEALIHPLVLQSVRDKANALPEGSICIIESALIYEIHWEKEFSAVIVVSCHRSEQFRRLQERGMHINDITMRLANQMPSSEKEARADIVVHTDCPLEDLGKKVHELYQHLKTFL